MSSQQKPSGVVKSPSASSSGETASTSKASIQLQMSSASGVPLQVPVSVPILAQGSGIPIQISAPDIGGLKLTGHPLQVQLGGSSTVPLFQLQLSGPANQNHSGSAAGERSGENASAEGNDSRVQSKDSGVPTQVKIQNANSVQGNGSNGVLQGTSKGVPPVMYIQTASGLKPTVANVGTSISGFSLRRPSTTASNIPNIQFLSALSKNSIVAKPTVTLSSTGAPKTLQPAKPAGATPPSVSVAPSTGGKHAFTTYVSTVKKPISGVKLQDSNQSIILQNPLLIPSGNNPKLLLNSMNVSKINANSKISLPGSMASKGPVINVQISNGQIQNDHQGKLTIMQPNTLLNSDIPPLQPLGGKTIPISRGNVIVPSVMQNVTTSMQSVTTSMSDKSFSANIPSGSRVEMIGEQEYALSIPENAANDEIYSVTLSDDSDQQNSTYLSFNDKTENSHSLSSNELCKQSDKESSNVFLQNSDKKVINIDTEGRIMLPFTETPDKSATFKDCSAKNLSHALSLISKNKVIEVSEEKPLPSLFCSEKLETDGSKEILKNKESYLIQKKSSESLVKIAPKPMLINKDRRKSRMSGDVHQSSKNKDSFKQSRGDISVDAMFDEDSLGIRWNDKTGFLKGSNLLFKTNEFGMIDVIESDDEDYHGKYGTPSKIKYESNGKKPTSPEDLCCCETCGCHGMAADFVNSSFCSTTCELNSDKHRNKLKEIELKKRRARPKKILIQKPKPKEEENCITDIQKCNPKFLEAYPEITITKMKNEKHKNKYPWISGDGVFSWHQWLEYCKAKGAPLKLFKDYSNFKNGFRIGMKMEAIDPVHASVFAVVTVSEIQGCRLKLHFDGYHNDHDFWVNADSCDIFPIGWCEKNSRVLRPPSGFTVNSFSWPLYLKQSKAIAAPRHLFEHVSSGNICPNGFRVGMKLEAEDRKDSQICVASVADVIDNRILIHFDNWSDIYDYWVDPTSPYIHPVGWCDENGYSLTLPDMYKDPESFTWEKYLNETNSLAVPPRAFKPRLPYGFKVGMKLEAVDKRVPFLVRCATVSDVRRHQIRISFDGWPDELSYWVDDDCLDIHEVGWCAKTGHPLEPPLTPDEFAIVGECGTPGCRGLGNSRGPKHTTHSLASECPYKAPVASPIVLDRLAADRPPPLTAEPKAREPKKMSLSRVLPKKRTEVVVSEDDNSNGSRSKKKRKLSPDVQMFISTEKQSNLGIKNSIYNPEYMPNPNFVAPPAWRVCSLRVEEVLQKLCLRSDPRNWSEVNVRDFIDRIINREDIAKEFLLNRIDGDALLMLTQDDLINIFKMRLGPALKVYNCILRLRQKILS